MKTISCLDAHGNKLEFDESEFVNRKSVYGILLKDDTVLMVQDHWSKRWALPGGGIDLEETESEALIREFKEETGIEITTEMTSLLSDVTYFMPSTENHPWRTFRSVYLVKGSEGELKVNGNNEDVLAAKYVPLKEAISIMSKWENDKQYADLLKNLT